MSQNFSLAEVYRHIQSRLREGGIDCYDLEARILLRQRAGFDWAQVISNPHALLPDAVFKQIESDIGRRIGESEPLSRILGTQSFYGLDFRVSPDVLDPRPDTEILIDLALKAYQGRRAPGIILDLGTGSGCIPITLLKHWADSHAFAVDISESALKIARENAAAHGVEDRISFVCGSWLEALERLKADLIVANPPYIASSVIPNLEESVRKFDPILALDGGESGLEAYKKILSRIKNVAKPKTKIFFEIGFDQSETIVRLVEESNLLVLSVHPDYAGQPRVVEISCGDK